MIFSSLCKGRHGMCLVRLMNDDLSFPSVEYVRKSQEEYMSIQSIIKDAILEAMYSTKTECNIKIDFIPNIILMEKIEKELNSLGYKASICLFKGCSFITINW